MISLASIKNQARAILLTFPHYLVVSIILTILRSQTSFYLGQNP